MLVKEQRAWSFAYFGVGMSTLRVWVENQRNGDLFNPTANGLREL